MKKLLTTTGGFPRVLDDLDYMQDGYFDGFKGLASASGVGLINEAGAILSGCEISGANITSGYILLNGEVLFFPGALAVIPIAAGDTAFFELNTTNFDANGNKTLQDTSSHDAYQERDAKLTINNSPPANHFKWGDDTGRTALTWEEELNGIDDVWHQPDGAGEPPLVGLWNQSTGSVPRLQFKKDKHGKVRLRGAIKDGTITLNTLDAIFILPVGYRPSNNAVGAITAALQGGVYGTVIVRIDIAGQVNVIGLPGSLSGVMSGGDDWVSFDMDFQSI